MTFTAAALIAAWLAILILALGLAGVLHQLRAVAAGASSSGAIGPAVGGVAPAIDGTALAGPALILFADPDCPSCDEVVPAFGRTTVSAAGGIRKLLVYRDAAPPSDHAPEVDTLAVEKADFDRWNVPVTPFLTAVNAHGTVVAAAPVGSAPVLRKHVKAIEEEGHLASLQ